MSVSTAGESGWKLRRSTGTSCRGDGGRRAGSDRAGERLVRAGRDRGGCQHNSRTGDFAPPHVGAGQVSTPLTRGLIIGGASTKACRTPDRKKTGTLCMVGTGVPNSAARSTASRLDHAEAEMPARAELPPCEVAPAVVWSSAWGGASCIASVVGPLPSQKDPFATLYWRGLFCLPFFPEPILGESGGASKNRYRDPSLCCCACPGRAGRTVISSTVLAQDHLHSFGPAGRDFPRCVHKSWGLGYVKGLLLPGTHFRAQRRRTPVMGGCDCSKSCIDTS